MRIDDQGKRERPFGISLAFIQLMGWLGLLVGLAAGMTEVIGGQVVLGHITRDSSLSLGDKFSYVVLSTGLSAGFFLIAGLFLALLSIVSGFLLTRLGTRANHVLALVLTSISYVVAGTLCGYLIGQGYLTWRSAYLARPVLAIILTILVGYVIYRTKVGETVSRAMQKLERLLFSVNRVAKPGYFGAVFLLLVLIGGFKAFQYQFNEAETNYAAPLKTGTPKNVNVILILIDTLRADHLSCYGYARETSSNLDRMASQGILFENAIAPSSWTKPSSASLLTGMYPSMHGAQMSGDVLEDSVETLAEVFQRNGYLTAGFVANPHLKKIFNFQQGFDFYDDSMAKETLFDAALQASKLMNHLRLLFHYESNWTDNNNIQLASKKYLKWLESNARSSFFLYLHLIDPHAPYSPPSPFKNKFFSQEKKLGKLEQNIAHYDAEILFTDFHLQILFDALQQLGIDQKTMIIVTSDHGEEFMDHGGSSHGQTLYDELVRVPLIFKADGLLPRGLRIDAQVELVDVMPTIVSLAGLENEAREMAYQGENLAGWWDPAFKKPSSPYAYLDQNKDSVYVMKAIRTNEWKYIYTEVSPRRDLKKDGPEELYDLKNDKREQLNIIEPAPAIMSALQHQLGEYTAFAQERGGTARKVEIDEATLKQLRALGYVQ